MPRGHRVGAMLVMHLKKPVWLEWWEVKLELKGSQILRSLAGCYRGFGFLLDEMKSHCRSRETSQEAIAEIQMKEDGGWNQGKTCVVVRLGLPM